VKIGVSQVEMLDDGGSVGGVVVHVMTIAHLRRAAMAASIMGDDAVSLVEEIEHLRVPIVRAQRPPMVEDDRLSILGAPVLVIDFRAVIAGDHAHCRSSFICAENILLASCLGEGGRRKSSRNRGRRPA
jgi:hypothetical protein